MKNIGNAYPKLIEQPVVPLNEEVASYLKDYFALLSRASCNENFEMDSELVELSLQTILTSIRLIYHKFPGEIAVRTAKGNLPGTDSSHHREL